MALNPFRAPKNYPEMLEKIAFFTFVFSLGLTILLATAWPTMADALNALKVPVTVLGIDGIPVLYLVPPVVIAFLARIFKLHDKVSDLLRIREVFDVREILTPLAGGVGQSVNLELVGKMIRKRDELMGRVFYKYASSTKPEIDAHLIILALDKWTWFWILEEAVVVGSPVLTILLVLAAWQQAAWLAVGLLGAVLIGLLIRRGCVGSAHAEVREILTVPKRVGEIKSAFDAL